MVTYLYWLCAFALTGVALYLLGWQLKLWGAGVITALALLGIFSLAYFFYFEQIFVKRWGGVMTVSVPKGQNHLAVTWKEDHFWMENYDPATNTCIFQEYSRSNILEGKVVIKNCNPLLPK